MTDTDNRKRGRGRPRCLLPDGVDDPNEFAQWMADDPSNRTVQAIAAVLGVSQATVYGWRRGNRPPSRRMAKRISMMTGGVVDAESWD